MVFIVATDVVSMGQAAKPVQHLIGPGSGNAVVTRQQIAFCTLGSCIVQHQFKGRKITVNVSDNGVFHGVTPRASGWYQGR